MPLPDLRAMNDRINALDHEAILEVRQSPSDHRGRIEALLVQARALNSGQLEATAEIADGEAA